jgi:hypothetical protein
MHTDQARQLGRKGAHGGCGRHVHQPIHAVLPDVHDLGLGHAQLRHGWARPSAAHRARGRTVGAPYAGEECGRRRGRRRRLAGKVHGDAAAAVVPACQDPAAGQEEHTAVRRNMAVRQWVRASGWAAQTRARGDTRPIAVEKVRTGHGGMAAEDDLGARREPAQPIHCRTSLDRRCKRRRRSGPNAPRGSGTGTTRLCPRRMRSPCIASCQSRRRVGSVGSDQERRLGQVELTDPTELA